MTHPVGDKLPASLLENWLAKLRQLFIAEWLCRAEGVANMEAGTQADHQVRFKSFELNLKTRELSHRGVRVRLYGQPIEVLRLLIEHAGEVVTRETLRKALWPEDIFVDFEHSLNSTMNRLREALGDSAEAPRLIETVPRVGYRFIAPVQTNTISVTDGIGSPNASGRASTTPVAQAEMPIAFVAAHSAGKRKTAYRLMAGIVLIAAPLVWYASRPLPLPRVGETVRLTSDPRFDKWLVGADASRIYLNVYPTAFGQVPVSGGNITVIPIDIVQKLRPFNTFPFGRLSPDGSSFLVQGHRDPKNQESDIWIIGSSGTPVRFLTRAWSAGWSADGKQVIYTTPEHEVFTLPSAGGEPHLIRRLGGSLDASGFESSPDGNRIRFNLGDHKMMEMSRDGSDLHEIMVGWHPDDIKCCGRWTLDGNFFLFLSANSSERHGIPAFQLWALDERHVLLRKPTPAPVQLTFGPMTWETPIPSRDRGQVFIKGNDIRGELVRYNRQTRQLEPFLGGISADMLDFSRDGKYVVYASFPGNTLWRADRDGREVQEIAKTIAHPTDARWSPDGSQIAFVDYPADGPAGVYVVPSQGGKQVRVFPDNQCCDELDPTWSPDGKQLAVLVVSPAGQEDKELRIVDLGTHQISHLPHAPKRPRLPRWSPDGRYIVCVTKPYPETDGLEVYDFKTQKWKILLTVPVGWPPVDWPSWSKNSRWIYYMGPDDLEKFHGVVFRISVNGERPERVADLPGFRPAGWLYSWFGVDPDANPIMLRDAGANEIYALTLEH